MSDPSFINITFQIKPNMPEDMKTLILYCFTDYFEKYFPDKKPSNETYNKLIDKYPEIADLYRGDVYHNVGLQRCQLKEFHIFNKSNIGLSIISLPSFSNALDKFFALVGPYIDSSVNTFGIMEEDDWSKQTWYYYIDSDNGCIKKHLIKVEDDDIVVVTYVNV